MALMKPKTKDEPKTETAPVQEAPAATKEQKLAEPKVDQPTPNAEDTSKAVAAVEPAPTQELVAHGEAANTNVTAFLQQQAEEGFEGLSIDGFSFDRIKLEDGKFLMGTEEVDLGESFQFRPMKSRTLYVVRQTSDGDAETFYSYDPHGLTNTDGTSAKEKLDAWKEDGYGTEEHPLDIRPYLEMFALFVGGNYDGQMVSLSIPPTSKSRFGGKVAEAQMRYGLGAGQCIFEASVGKKVGEGSKSFKPWNFKFVRAAE